MFAGQLVLFCGTKQPLFFGQKAKARAETKHIPKVYDAAPLNDRLKELIRAVIFVSIDHGCFAKLGPLQGFDFFTSIH